VRITGVVRDFRTNDLVPGALVTIGDVPRKPVGAATTDVNGAYSVVVPAGQQLIAVDGEVVGAVILRDQTYRGDLLVHGNGCIGRYGTVVDSGTRRPVVSATASLTGVTTTTDASGWFTLSLGCPGTICSGLDFGTTVLTVTHADYQNGSFVVGRGACRVERVDYELVRR